MPDGNYDSKQQHSLWDHPKHDADYVFLIYHVTGRFQAFSPTVNRFSLHSHHKIFAYSKLFILLVALFIKQ